MRQTGVWPLWKFGHPRENMKRVSILGQKKIKANAEKRLMLEQIEKGMLFKRQN